MSKNVLISIRPQWIEKICHKIGEKDGRPIYEKEIEVRKDEPMQVQVPFKCLIYETYDKEYDGIGVRWEKGNTFEHACKKVIGEFICDRIVCSQAYFDSQGKNHLTNVFAEDIKKTCLTEYELWNYIAGKAVKANEMYDGWLWHISDLKIYDRPKELNEFTPVCRYKGSRCDICSYYEYNFGGCCKTLSRPPQSWCYVEE